MIESILNNTWFINLWPWVLIFTVGVWYESNEEIHTR
jgi:hypothetical protein